MAIFALFDYGRQASDTIGNGKATCVLFVREGAHVAVVDNQMERAQDTVSMVKSEGGQAFPLVAVVMSEVELKK